MANVTFKSKKETSNDFQIPVEQDSLFLDIYQSTSKPLLDEDKAPSNIQIVYWRDLSKKDKVAGLDMALGADAKYSIKM